MSSDSEPSAENEPRIAEKNDDAAARAARRVYDGVFALNGTVLKHELESVFREEIVKDNAPLLAEVERLRTRVAEQADIIDKYGSTVCRIDLDLTRAKDRADELLRDRDAQLGRNHELQQQLTAALADVATLGTSNQRLNRRAQAAEANEREQFKSELAALGSYRRSEEMAREWLVTRGYAWFLDLGDGLVVPRGSAVDRSGLRLLVAKVLDVDKAVANRDEQLVQLTADKQRLEGEVESLRRQLDEREGETGRAALEPDQRWLLKRDNTAKAQAEAMLVYGGHISGCDGSLLASDDCCACGFSDERIVALKVVAFAEMLERQQWHPQPEPVTADTEGQPRREEASPPTSTEYACGAINPKTRTVCVMSPHHNGVGHVGRGETWFDASPLTKPPECPCCPDGCRDPHTYVRYVAAGPERASAMTCYVHRFCCRECRDRALKKIEETRVQAVKDHEASTTPDGYNTCDEYIRSLVELDAKTCQEFIDLRCTKDAELAEAKRELAAAPRFLVTPEVREMVTGELKRFLATPEPAAVPFGLKLSNEADRIFAILGITVRAEGAEEGR